jgi:HAD superfamily hydrolase (TIGR01509 family)
MIHNIIWDLDGTLFDTYPGIARAFETAFTIHGVKIPYARLYDLARISFRHCVDTLSVETGIDPQPLFETFIDCYASIPPNESPPYPGVGAVLKTILKIGGKNAIVTHRGRESTFKLLDYYRLRYYFATVVSHDDGFARKPAPDAFFAVIERLGIKPEETLAIGDRDLDLQAAANADLVTCAYGAGPCNEDANLSFESFDMLLQWLKLSINKD